MKFGKRDRGGACRFSSGLPFCGEAIQHSAVSRRAPKIGYRGVRGRGSRRFLDKAPAVRWLLSRILSLMAEITGIAGGANSSIFQRGAAAVTTLFLGLPLWLLSASLKPFLEIRFLAIPGPRLGHLVAEADCLISKKIPNRSRVLYFVFFAGPPVNTFFGEILRKRLIIWPTFLVGGAFVWQQVFTSPLSRHWAVSTPYASGLTLSSKWVEDDLNMKQLEQLLESFDLDPVRPYVCLWVRDSSYGSTADPLRNQDYSSHRDSTIANHLKMCETLQQHGYSVVRMGRVTQDDTTTNKQAFFDYSSDNQRSDRNDFLLTKFCAFAISGDSGSVFLPILYRKPLALVNIGGFVGVQGGESVKVVALKRLEWQNTGLPVSSSQILQRSMYLFTDKSQFEKLGVEIFENTPEELEGVALDMLDVLGINKLNESAIDLRLRKAFMEKVELMGLVDSQFLPSRRWLAANPQFSA